MEDIGPSLVVQWKERALEERTGPDFRGPGEVDMVRQRIHQVQSLSSFFSLVGSDPLTLQGRMTCGVKTMDASVDPGSLASMEKCASTLIQRMGTGQWIILEGGRLKRSGRTTEL